MTSGQSANDFLFSIRLTFSLTSSMSRLSSCDDVPEEDDDDSCAVFDWESDAWSWEVSWASCCLSDASEDASLDRMWSLRIRREDEIRCEYRS